MEWTKDWPSDAGYYLIRRPINGRASHPTCVLVHPDGAFSRPIPIAEPGRVGGATLLMALNDRGHIEEGTEWFGPLDLDGASS